ncbi:MAG: DUF2500 family protein [Clostridia bacterium]|nr:DUF2500 family protein [Clostridia bacterium]
MIVDFIIGFIFKILIPYLCIEFIFRSIFVKYFNVKETPLELYSDEISNDLEENASILNMNCYIEQNNDFLRPDHKQKYKVTFSLDDETQKVLDVSMEDYNNMNVGERGKLITQNNCFYEEDGTLISQNDLFLGFEI